ncbi:MAG TPA: choice-of-anchor tandem repeat GloVer-containing protein [Bryobacteraceae bacterium]|nr:choice-of-anchor tandem repeat GloVer-containing protein [Bryobacteraceae bacterium]
MRAVYKMSKRALVLCAMAATSLSAQTFTALFGFDGANGKFPQSVLKQATDGDFYGTAQQGGAHGYGTVFKITSGGTLTTLYSFCARSGCTDGEYPLGLIQATNGNFYGTTVNGGAHSHGTVFKITPSGRLTTLYSFCVQSGCTDGSFPQAGLVQATNGNFYGTTYGGGAYGYGTVFKISPTGALATLYSFCAQSGCADGEYTFAGLIQATDGNFYGTTYQGGAYGYGTVFKITASGALETLYSFCAQTGCADGEYAHAGLVQATNGDFYGTTQGGGGNGNYGTVFKITPGGALETLYSFCAQSGCPDGMVLDGGLLQATDGDFYGAAASGGPNGSGTVFKISAGGTLATQYSFCAQSGCADGATPLAGLFQATNGNFYGTTVSGGAHGDNDGTLFSLSVGLGPFVKTVTTSGKVGATVEILGTDLTGATSVTFNGAAASFTVVSSSEITATVPAGASTGNVQVVTPGGTLTSNVRFRVT